mmetsp:Transcript_5850/g.8245  ORF Transcript_5850/g.8245 Transcript_5850/m.8245 type:complete len:225 (-) Transcript_5850:515-1189(-)
MLLLLLLLRRPQHSSEWVCGRHLGLGSFGFSLTFSPANELQCILNVLVVRRYFQCSLERFHRVFRLIACVVESGQVIPNLIDVRVHSNRSCVRIHRVLILHLCTVQNSNRAPVKRIVIVHENRLLESGVGQLIFLSFDIYTRSKIGPMSFTLAVLDRLLENLQGLIALMRSMEQPSILLKDFRSLGFNLKRCLIGFHRLLSIPLKLVHVPYQEQSICPRQRQGL